MSFSPKPLSSKPSAPLLQRALPPLIATTMISASVSCIVKEETEQVNYEEMDYPIGAGAEDIWTGAGSDEIWMEEPRPAGVIGAGSDEIWEPEDLIGAGSDEMWAPDMEEPAPGATEMSDMSTGDMGTGDMDMGDVTGGRMGGSEGK